MAGYLTCIIRKRPEEEPGADFVLVTEPTEATFAVAVCMVDDNTDLIANPVLEYDRFNGQWRVYANDHFTNDPPALNLANGYPTRYEVVGGAAPLE